MYCYCFNKTLQNNVVFYLHWRLSVNKMSLLVYLSEQILSLRSILLACFIESTKKKNKKTISYYFGVESNLT